MENYILFKKEVLTGSLIRSFDISFNSSAIEFSDMVRSINSSKTVKVLKTSEVCDKEFTDVLSFEKYAIKISTEEVIIYCDSVRAMFYALNSLTQMLEMNTCLKEGIYYAYPSLKMRGLIEGYYGKPWSMKQRKRAIEIMAQNRMNTYIYAPKDDPFHREFWRELYDEEGIKLLRDMFTLCKNNHMSLQYMLSPGLDMKYSDADEIDLIFKKFLQAYDLGIRDFGILFDDIFDNTPEGFNYDEDRNMFAEVVEAHVFVVNKVYEKLQQKDKNTTLIVCPTQYHGSGTEPYITKLGRGINENCSVFFTGEKICSEKITTKEAKLFYDNNKHKPVYWDNYPVNDMEMTNEFHISPIIKRDKDLYKYCDGITLNPMEFAESSLLNIITYAHYMWDSENYSPEESFDISIKYIAGEKYLEPFKAFDEFLYKSCLLKQGYHYREEIPTEFNGNVIKMIDSENYSAIKEYMLNSKVKISILKELQAEFFEEFDRWYYTALNCCDAFVKTIENLSRGKDKYEIILPLLDYLCMPEDIMKHECKLLISKIV